MRTNEPLQCSPAKALGAYYTDAQVADFLVQWAIRQMHETVLDPSFGGGVFLRSACKRLTRLGGSPATQVFGIELDPGVHARITEKLEDEFGVQRRNLRQADFFSEPPSDVDVIVGNPPFIRYQRFTGDVRKRALACAEEHGVRLSELSSSWLPFLLYSISHLKHGGRLAMVMPVELTHAAYALPALEIIARSFEAITFLTFRKKLFPDLSENTLLLLAENKGGGPARFWLRDVANPGKLAELHHRKLCGTRLLDSQRVASGQERIIEYLISKKARDLYRQLKTARIVRRLGDLADVGIGYVTGANDFFHLHPDTAKLWRIPETFLRPAIRRGRSLGGIEFTSMDWVKALDAGETGYLLYLRPNDPVTPEVAAYLARGEAAGVHHAYKCRVRNPWYSVPHVYQPDAFLSYMSGITPRLVANHANAVAPNSLHILRLHDRATMSPNGLASLWQTSLTRLSAELEGHALGGGMLKMEPTEAESVLVASGVSQAKLKDVSVALDEILRTSGDGVANGYADKMILQRELGLTPGDCALLQQSAQTLRARRYHHGTT